MYQKLFLQMIGIFGLCNVVLLSIYCDMFHLAIAVADDEHF